MGARPALSPSEKEFLVQRKQAGASHAEVARDLHCAPETVRKQWKAFRHPWTRHPRGRPACGLLGTYPPEIRQQAIQLKRDHRYWGPINVLLELSKTPGLSRSQLPSPSRLAVLFQAECPEAVRASRKKEPVEPPQPAGHALHSCWQADAKEKIRLCNGEVASILEIREPYAGLRIRSQAFETTLTADTYRKLTLPETRTTFRLAFCEWGRPAEVQTDREDLYAGANQSDFPTVFTLWLRGLGIRHLFSRPHCPTDQSQIERNHRTSGELSWKNRPPADLADLQSQLEAGRFRHNYEYPSHAADCEGLPPLVRHPPAGFSGRPYPIETEWELFDLAAVDHYLAQFSWTRKVDQNGVVWVGNHTYYLGKPVRGQSVQIRFLEEERAFCFETETGERIKTLPAKGLEKTDLTGLIPNSYGVREPFQLTLPTLVGV